ncbi:hypothetical protein EXIGLDRAFT_724660 [Exidia glandulosa HHB12029]|uniref:Uncharacterized protein n=1 Tax=Exidia glandulosa HHB12029 TaxID=1314781 RepID=A0A165MRQ5_EXIGL|nr:hypothetical protein EXIGLDRAFT_724660 [Exidia glandulosa HHB12029]
MSRTRVLALGYRQWLDVSLYQSLVRAAPGVTALYCPLDVFIDPTAPIVCSPSSLMLVSADRVDTWPPAHALPFSNLQRLYLESLPCDADVWLDDATVALLTQLTHYGCRTSSDYVWTVDTMVEHLRPIRALPSLRIILLHSHFFLQSPYTNLGGWFDEVAELKDPRIYASPSSLSLQVWLSIQDDPQSDWWETSGVQVWSG